MFEQRLDKDERTVLQALVLAALGLIAVVGTASADVNVLWAANQAGAGQYLGTFLSSAASGSAAVVVVEYTSYGAVAGGILGAVVGAAVGVA